MAKQQRTAIEPTREVDYPEWYQQVVKAADLAENSPVRGCMVIKPWGYRLWENIQKVLDRKFKETGHENAYFPLFIPLSFLQKEAAHVEGFAKECAVVTHHRLEMNSEGKLIPASPLEEPLVVRPTSETIIGEMFSKWVSSYRDLPILINQWANVVRWEMRTRIFLRTTEFLWQEGHTAHANENEARQETTTMLNIYEEFAKEYLAIPVIKGEKTESERFPGATATYTIEAMMQDRKALQAGTSHFLGQNFAKAAGIRFTTEDGTLEHAWTTSWGVTTRLIGALIMAHSDDDGLVMPPRIASAHVVIIPIIHNEESKASILEYCQALKKTLTKIHYEGEALKVILDDRDMRAGEKSWNWIKKGVPLRIEIGPREIQEDRLSLAFRNKPHKEYAHVTQEELIKTIPHRLEVMQQEIYHKALSFRNQHMVKIDTEQEFYEFFTPKNSSKPETHGGFALTHYSGDPLIEEKLRKDLNVTVRCIPLDFEKEEGICPFTGSKSPQRVIYAKSY